MRLLEEFEYYPKFDGRWPRTLGGLSGWVLGLSVMTCGLFGLGVIIVKDLGLISLPLYMIGVMVLLSGIYIVIGSLSREQFARFNKQIESKRGRVSTFLYACMAIILIIIFSVIVYISILINNYSKELDYSYTLIASITLLLTSLSVVIATRANQIRLGIIGLRNHLLVGVWSLWIDTIALAIFLAAPVVLLFVLGSAVAWIPAAITAGIAVIGTHVSRVRKFASNIASLIATFDAIRAQAFMVTTDHYPVNLYREIRRLQLWLAQAPGMKAPFTFAGMTALCAVADSRHISRSGARVSFRGETRDAAAEQVHELTEAEFAEQIGWLFDALLQQIDKALTPNLKRVDGDDVRAIYQRSAPSA